MKQQLNIKVWMLFAVLFMGTASLSAQSDQAVRNILDKAAAIVGNRGGASAHFKVATDNGIATSGSISRKQNKFRASTPQAIIWYNGKTQWTYIKKNKEVNISTPAQTQQAVMNPYAFINLYKKGYKLSSTSTAKTHQVHLVATDKVTFKEVYININKVSFVPSSIKVLQNGSWTTISISNFKAGTLPESTFVFNAKDYPSVEIIDLR